MISTIRLSISRHENNRRNIKISTCHTHETQRIEAIFPTCSTLSASPHPVPAMTILTAVKLVTCALEVPLDLVTLALT